MSGEPRGELTAVGDRLTTPAASSPRETGATVGLSPAAPAAPAPKPAATTAQPAAQPQTGEPHGFDFSKLEIPAEDAPFIDGIATHIRALGGEQAHAELGVKVVQRIQAANDKADEGIARLTADAMRIEL